MDPVVRTFSQLLTVNDGLLRKALEGTSDEEAWRAPGADANPLYWIAGHLAIYRNNLAQTLGAGGRELAWASLFRRTSQPDAAAGGPKLAEILETLLTSSQQLQERFPQLQEADLAVEAAIRVPSKDRTIRGLIAFMVYHEAYHVGQLAYLKKWLGYPGIIDGQ